jgi:hypothetical protein
MLSLQVDYLRRISSISRIELTDGRRGRGRGWGRMEPKKNAWSSINHSIHSGVKALLSFNYLRRISSISRMPR